MDLLVTHYKTGGTEMFLGTLLLFAGLALAVGSYIGVVGFDIDWVGWLVIPAYLLATAGLIIAITSATAAGVV